MTKPDPELLPVQRPLCPKCQVRMTNIAVDEGPEGFEHRTFECSRCGQSETRIIALDPMKSDALGWINGELGRLDNMAAPQDGNDQRLLLKPAR